MNDIELLHGDCVTLMNDISDKSIDMILSDLPYGTTLNQWDIIIPFDNLWKQYTRIIKNNGVIILFAQGMFTIKLISSNEKMWRYNLIWDKELTSGFLNANRQPLRQHEDICVFYKEQPTYNPQKIIGDENHSKGYMLNNTNNNYGDFKLQDIKHGGMKYPTSILRFQKPHPSVEVHPTQKPVDLLKYLIKTYSNENDVVLDNCMGSGSTGVACIETNRRFIGIELDESYFDIACRRIKNAKYQPEGANVRASLNNNIIYKSLFK